MKNFLKEWLGINDLQEILAQHDARIADLEELIDALTPVVPEYKVITVYRDGKNVNLSWANGYNDNGKPIFTFYPSDSAPVENRIQVPSGTDLRVTERVVGDGGNVAWKLYEEIQPGVQLYVMEKFIVG